MERKIDWIYLREIADPVLWVALWISLGIPVTAMALMSLDSWSIQPLLENWWFFALLAGGLFAFHVALMLALYPLFWCYQAFVDPWLDELPYRKKRQAEARQRIMNGGSAQGTEERGFWFSLSITLGLTAMFMITSYFDDRGTLMPLHEHWVYFAVFASFVLVMTPWAQKIFKTALQNLRKQDPT